METQIWERNYPTIYSSLITAALATPSQQRAESLLEPTQRSRFVERSYLDMRLPQSRDFIWTFLS
jgi:hypothetical protein